MNRQILPSIALGILLCCATETRELGVNMSIARSQSKQEDTWNIAALYPSLQSWYVDHAAELTHSYKNEFTPFQAENTVSPIELKKILDTYYATERRLRKLYTYAHLLHDQEIDNEDAKTALQLITSLYHTFSEETAWIEPVLLSYTEEALSKYSSDPMLSSYSIFLTRLLRKKKHTLSPEQEMLLTRAHRATEATSRAFSSLTDADFVFPDVEDSKGQKFPLTNATYSIYLRSFDRDLRKNAFNTLHNQYKNFQNTLCDLLKGSTESHVFQAKSHNFDTCLEAALHDFNIPPTVYSNLIKTVRSHVDVLHRYTSLRKKALQLDILYPWDLYVPLSQEGVFSYSYDQAVALTLAALSPLGEQYTNVLSRGLLDQRWVDRYENKGKRSGAYSSGCYDSFPYILLNYTSQLKDVFTLAHEAGHSMHSFYSKTQPYHLSDYPIFVAEVASTFNEELLSKELLKRASHSPAEKRAILVEKLEEIRGTLFRQTLFAEFELFFHSLAESNSPITPGVLNAKYIELTKEYYGPDLEIPENYGVEWAKIPHFYYNFYVYQYATGISAAIALAQKVSQGDPDAVSRYIDFLHSGGSLFPIDALKKAGVDMTSSQPIEETIRYFSALLDAYELSLKE